MSVRALQDYTFVSKYARYNSDLKRRETWGEAIDRVRDMHIRKYPQIQKEIKWAFEQVRQRRVLGSQRALQFGGRPIEKTNARIFNCSASYCDRIRFFQECFWLLLCGTGTGFSVQKHHIAKLPNFAGITKGKKVYVIPDSIEGWADSLGVLMSSYFGGGDFPQYAGYEVVYDYSLIRPEGAMLNSCSGKAPGPKPLEKALERIREHLTQCLSQGLTRLRPIDAYDIAMHASDAVLSGGVRRSATLVLFSPDDEEMAMAKTGNWFVENPQRGRSNNSALLLKETTTKEEFDRLMQFVRQFGEPGFLWSDSTEHVVNPCCEISFYAYEMESGLSGWAFCNLTEINGKKCRTKKDFARACKAAAIIGTCQAGYSDMSYLGEISRKIVEREALLGVSITGIMDHPEVLLNPKNQKAMAQLILDVNSEVAAKIGINPSARTTCIKPAGTTSCILGTASGIHPHHAKRYIRRVQGNYLEKPLQFFKKYNPKAVQKSVWNANGTDEIISFCVEVPNGSKTKNDVGALELLNFVKDTQENWVMTGTRKELCVQPWLVHNVSNTISVRDDEWDLVRDFIYDNRRFFAGVSLLPITGDKDYPQAPFTAIYTPLELVRMYGDASVMASGLIVDGLHAFNDNLWAACDCALGRGEPLTKPTAPSWAEDENVKFSEQKKYNDDWKIYDTKVDWVRRAHQFAKRYFGDDVRKMTYCLKDVNNWHYWCSLKHEYVDIDYTKMQEEEDNTKFTQESACAGGRCEII